MTAKNIGKKVIKAPIAIRKFTPAKHFANAKIASFVVKEESATVPTSVASGYVS